MAITFMSCQMGMKNRVCLCEDNSGSKYEQIVESQSPCCKIKVQEVNNSNTFEISKLSLAKAFSVYLINYQPSTNLNLASPLKSKLLSEHQKTPVDIPILISTLRI